MHRNMRLHGKWMYERSDIVDLLNLVDAGLLKMNKDGGLEIVGEYSLDEWKAAWDDAAENTDAGRAVVLRP